MNDANFSKKGFGSVEIIVVASILFIMTVAVSGALFTSQKLARSASDLVHANLLIEETAEAIQLLRDQSWADNFGTVSLGAEYYLIREPSAYSLSTLPPSGVNYYATVNFSSVNRNSNGGLDESGDVDPDTLEGGIKVYRSVDNQLITEGTMLIHNAYEN